MFVKLNDYISIEISHKMTKGWDVTINTGKLRHLASFVCSIVQWLTSALLNRDTKSACFASNEHISRCAGRSLGRVTHIVYKQLSIYQKCLAFGNLCGFHSRRISLIICWLPEPLHRFLLWIWIFRFDGVRYDEKSRAETMFRSCCGLKLCAVCLVVGVVHRVFDLW